MNELLDGGLAIERPEKEVVQHGVVQDHDTGPLESAAVDLLVKLVIPEVIEVNVGVERAGGDFAPLPQSGEQCRGIRGHATRGGRQRSMESDGQAFRLGPNNAEPTRMCVAPSSMAAVKSYDVPIESPLNPCCSAK